MKPSSYDDKYEGDKDLSTLFSNRLNDLKGEIKVQLPCKVKSVNLVRNSVDVEILDYDNHDGQLVNYPIIPDVPIRQPIYSGSAYMILPTRVGDIGTIEFFDTSVDDVVTTGNYDYDYSEDWHNLNNGLFTNGFLPKGKIIPVDPASKVVFATTNNVFTFTVGADDNLVITTPTMILNGNLVINGDITQSGNLTTSGSVTATGEVTGNGKALSTHTHTGNQGAPTSPPN